MPPPEDDINMFREVTGGFATRDTAIRFIDGAAGNIENAMNDYWTNPDKYDVGYQGYDESQFHADREGNVGAGIPCM
jgi:bacillopeptidase F (M6 metalloprotease family)